MLKKFICSVAIVALAINIGLAVFAHSTVHALGESYTVVDANTITATGGAFGSQTVTFTKWQNNPTVKTVADFSALIEDFTPTLKHCVFEIDYDSAANSYHIDTSARPNAPGAPNKTTCNPNEAAKVFTPGQTTAADGDGLTIHPENPTNATPSTDATDAAGTTKSKPTCDSSGTSLSWILCPVIDGLANATDSIYNGVVVKLLRTSPINLTDPKNDPTHLYDIWSNFRIYGNILLVMALLVVVFGETIGGGLIDAYTIKKMLPRILIAAILINLSIYIVAALVDITNILGNGVIALITTPFKDAGGLSLSFSGDTAGIGIAAILGTAGTIWALAPAAISFIAMFVVLPAFLAIVGVVVTVIIRRGLILFLILVSPVAFALYVLPNTEQYFRKWWDLLFRTLLVYPIIALIFAISKVLAFTINAAGSTGAITGPLAQIMSIVALILPLFLIPYAFRFAGGVIGSIHEQVSNYRQKTHGAIKGDDRDQNSLGNRVRRGMNIKRAEKGLTGAMINTRLNPTTMVGSRRNLRKTRLGAQQTSKLSELGNDIGQNNPLFAVNKDDDKVMTDLFKYGSGKESRDAIMQQFNAGKINAEDRDQLLSSSAIADKIGRNRATRRLAGMQGSTLSYGLGAGHEGWNEAVVAMQQISGGSVARNSDGSLALDADGNVQRIGGDDNNFRNMVNQFQYVAKQVGRADLSGNTDSGKYNAERAWNSVNLYTHSNGKPVAIEGMGNYWTKQYEEALATNNIAGITKARKAMYEFKELKQNATGGVADQANKVLADFSMIDQDHADALDALTPADRARLTADFQLADRAAGTQARRFRQEDLSSDPTRRESSPPPGGGA